MRSYKIRMIAMILIMKVLLDLLVVDRGEVVLCFEYEESEFVEGKAINCVVVSDVVSRYDLDTDVSQNVS